MEMTYLDARGFIAAAEAKGSVTIFPGVFLFNKAKATTERDNIELGRDTNLASAPYWIVADNCPADPIHNADQLIAWFN